MSVGITLLTERKTKDNRITKISINIHFTLQKGRKQLCQ